MKQNSTSNPRTEKNYFKLRKLFISFLLLLIFTVTNNNIYSQTTLGGVNLGNLPNYLFVFTDGSYEAKWQGSTKGYAGDVAVDGVQANETTSGTVAYAGTMYTNSSTLSNWQGIVDDNSGQAYRSLNQTSRISALETDFSNAMSQIASLPASAGFTSVSSTSLNGLNKQNGLAETFVINITSGLQVSSKIVITGDAGDIFILRWDTDGNPSNGYNGQVKFQSGGAIVPGGGLKATNFINVAGDINASGGGTNPSSPYPQGPRLNNGTGALIAGGSDFDGGGFFTGYWLTTGDPSDLKTYDLSNAIFVGGWYSSTIKLKMTSGTSGVYVSPPVPSGTASIGDRVWNDVNNNGLQDPSETGGIPGVSIQLKNSSGAVVATTTSGNDGYYQFNGLVAGTYTVVFPTTYGGAVLSPAKVGSNNNIDSDPNQTTGATANITVTAGQTITTVDAGYFGFTGLTLGNKVFLDGNRSGLFDAGDGPVANVLLRLYKDDNNDNIPDGAAIALTNTNTSGEYKFENLSPGNYIVGVDMPANLAITILNGGDPDNDIDNDNNALIKVGNEARGNAITLSFGGEPSGGGNINNTYDFGFYDPTIPPNGGQSCFIGVNPQVYAKSFWNVNANSQTVTVRVTFSKYFVDNCYKASGNADNWNRSHTFGNLTGSDHLQWSLKNGNGTEVLNFKQDFISANSSGYNYPSGYGTLGFSGDGNTPSVGLASDVLSFRTSLSSNFNDFGYVLTSDSPPTDTNYTANPTYPNWIYDTWYEVTLKASAFGASGFGIVDVSSVHASPSKTGNNTETITNTPCVSSIGDRVWFDTNGDGIQDAGENGIMGVTVKLRNNANTVIATTSTNSAGNYLFSNLNPGTYTVEFPVTVYGYKLSPAYVGSNRNIDSDPSVTTGITPVIVLGTAENITSIDAGYSADCDCTNSTSNLLINGSFENGTTGWTLSGGNLTTGTGYVMCGSKNGFLNQSSGTARMYQDVSVVAGSTVNFSGYSGTHTPGISCSPKLSLIFLNSSNAVISQQDVTVTRDVDVTGSALELYSLSGIAPVGTVKVRVQGSISCNTLKVDGFCLTVTAPPSALNPDFNSTFVNVAVPGDVSTNDKVPSGTTYGTPTLSSSPAGSTPSITLNPNGTYSFVTNVPGVYTYKVPVCVPGQVTPCPTTDLVITVLSTGINTNAPVANVDIATTKINTAVTLKTLANDAAGNATTSLVPSSVTVTVAPLNGTATVNPANGDITYTPATGFTGSDTLTYQVCDNQSPAKCATAKQVITIIPAGAPNTTTAADDYKTTPVNTVATGNVKTNDSDAEGNTQTVTAQNTTIAGKGTLVLATDGTYTFTPVSGYTGPVDFPYTTCDNGTPQACASATLHVLVIPVLPQTNPDFNSTFVNVAVPGDVSTNDKVPSGTIYGTPTLSSSPAGSTPSITLNPNGTYSFVTNVPGVYTYKVPVCVPGQVTPCPTTDLVITVLNSNVNTNAPVANVDIATTKINTAVTLKTLANDAAGNATTSLVPGSVTITASPLHGTATVNPANGDITYTPATGFTGSDTLTYQVCDNQSPAKCATAKQVITIIPAGTPNTTTAADDYKITAINTNALGNVKTNDSDAEGNTQTVTAQNTSIAGKGSLVLATDGNYTFVPVSGYTGPVDFPYTTCDNGTPQACATATLHILVVPPTPQTNPDFNSTYVNVTVPGNVSTNDKVPAGTTYGTSPTLASGPAGSTPVLTMSSTGGYTFVTNVPGVYTYKVPVCVPGQTAPCPPTDLVITVLDANVNTNGPVANVDIATTNLNTPVTLKSLANDAAGNPGIMLVPGSVTITVAPLHGTTSVNPATGDITYTPFGGYIGTDTLTYQVCDNQSPAKCATAKQIITIKSTTAPNTTTAADDYKITPVNTAATGNVKTNDSDAEGNTQTVTAQNTTIAGKGTLVLATDGSYTFTPVTGYTGPVDFPYTTCDNGTPQACATATLHILVVPPTPQTNPDFNSTYVNVTVPGNVSTNDKVPAGTTYGTSPTLASGPAGSTPVLTMSSTGGYTFVTNVPGVYTYKVPVCVPGQTAPCPPTDLVITVLDANVNTNGPVANVDIATTNLNTPVTLKSLANDAAGNAGIMLVPGSVTVTAAPLHGTTSVNPATGDITYTPFSGYIGTDTLTYQVCDNQSPAKCATAKQIITIKSTTAPNTTTAADDYKITPINIAATGNVKTNDSDAEGNTQTVTAQNTTIAGKGTLVLATDGTYTFTPVTGYTGPVDFPYTTCDNGTPQACASATLHILVTPPVPLMVPDFNSTFVNVTVPGNVNTNDKVPAGTTYGTSPALSSSPAGSTPVLTMNSDGTYTFVTNLPGVYTYKVPVCVPGKVPPCPVTDLVITVLNSNVNTNPPVANVDVAMTKVNTPVTLKTLANDAPGDAVHPLVPSSVTVTTPPLYGTTSVNPATGDITYTPNAGYVGPDTLTYQVCDNQSPAKCATAKQIIMVMANGTPNTTIAADDYKTTPINTATSGNVKTNDSDPEGDIQTVTAQTTTMAGKGTLLLNTDGSYSFVPVNGFTGPVDFPYTTCDNGTPQACATATLHILVKPVVPLPDFTPSNDIDALSFPQNNLVRDLVVNINEVLNKPSNGQVIFNIRKLSAFTITYNPTATNANVFGGSPVNNADWTFTENANFITCTLKTGKTINGFDYSPVGFTITRNAGVPVNTSQNITVTIITGTGGDSNNANNQAVTTITAN